MKLDTSETIVVSLAIALIVLVLWFFFGRSKS